MGSNILVRMFCFFLCSCVIQSFCFKNVETGCFLVPIPPSNSLFKVGMNKLMETLFLILLNRIGPAGGNIVDFSQVKRLAYCSVDTL